MKDLTLIFDFDGTICDSYVASIETMNELATKFGYRRVDEPDYESLKDLSFKAFQAKLGIAAYKIPLVLHQGRRKMRTRVSDLSPIPGVPEALRRLKREGVTLGVLTSNSGENVEAFLRENGVVDFDFIRGGSSLFGKGGILKKLVKKSGKPASTFAYVGDEARDVRAAREAGIAAVAVAWGFNSRRLLDAAKPDAVLVRPGELVDYARSLSDAENRS